MPDQNVLESILRLTADEPAAAKAARTIGGVEDAYNDVKASLLATNKQAITSTQAIEKLNQSFAQIGRQRAIETISNQFKGLPPQLSNTRGQLQLIAEQLSIIGASDDEIRRVASSLSDMGKGGPRGGTGGVGTRGEVFGDAETAVRALGVGGIVPDLLGASEGLVRLKESITNLPQAAKAAIEAIGIGNIGLIGGIAAATIAIKLLADEANRVKEGARAQIDAQLEYFSVVSTGTTESLTVEKAAADERVKAAQAAADHAKFINAEFERGIVAAFGELGLAHTKLNIALGTGGGELKATQDAMEAANKELVAAQAEQALYTRALQDGRVAANDAAIAEAELAKARQLLVDQLADVQIRALISATSSSSDATNKRMEAIRNEIEVTQRFLDAGGLSAEKTAELSNRITLLSQELVTLNLEVLPVIQARERETAALAYQKKQLEDTAAAVQKYNEDVAAIEQRNLEARQQASERYYDRVTAIAEAAAQAAENALRQLQQRRADLARDLARAGEDAETERRRDELDAQVDFQRDEAKAAREHAEELKRIRRQALRDETQAVQDRDAVALDAAQTRKRDEIHDAHENYQQAARERRIAFNQEASDRRVAFERERADRLLKYQRDLADAQAAYQQDLAFAAQKRQQDLIQAQAAYRQDLATLQQKYTQELTARRNAAVAELRLIQQTESQRVQIMAQAQQALINQARALLTTVGASAASSIPLSGGVGNAPFPAPPQLASGGHITRTGLALVHKGETIINPARGQSAASSVILNLNGMQAKEIDVRSKQHAIDTVVTVLQEML